MASFEEFVQAELPLRQVVTFGIGDPRIVGAQGAIGSYFLDTEGSGGGYPRYEKIGSGAVDWRKISDFTGEIASLIASRNEVAAASGAWNQNLTDLAELSAKVDDTFYTNFNSQQNSINGFIAHEWHPDLIKKSSTVTLADGRIYILCTSDGSSVYHYLGVNLKPIVPFYQDGLSDYGVVNTYPLSAFRACKYTIELDDVELSFTHYGEINVLCNGIHAVASEYSSLHSSPFPMVEYGAVTDGVTVSLTALSLVGDMSDKQFKGIRTNFFN